MQGIGISREARFLEVSFDCFPPNQDYSLDGSERNSSWVASRL